MIVLKSGLNIYQPKLSIESCIILEQLYGSITAPIEKQIPSLSEQVFLISLCLRQYMLSEDQIYELFDEIREPYTLIIALYEEAGLINTKQDSEPVNEKQTSSDSELKEQQDSQTFEEMCNDMLVQCLAIGLSRQEFFNSTLKEITQFVDAYKRQQQNKLEEQAFFSWQTANLIGSSVARLLSKDAKYPKLEEAYPFVKDDKPQEQDNNELTAEERKFSAQMLEWAMAMNRKQEKKKAQQEQSETDKVE